MHIISECLYHEAGLSIVSSSKLGSSSYILSGELGRLDSYASLKFLTMTWLTAIVERGHGSVEGSIERHGSIEVGFTVRERSIQGEGPIHGAPMRTAPFLPRN